MIDHWYLPTSDSGQDSDLDPARMPAEIVVLLDSEDNQSLRSEFSSLIPVGVFISLPLESHH